MKLIFILQLDLQNVQYVVGVPLSLRSRSYTRMRTRPVIKYITRSQPRLVAQRCDFWQLHPFFVLHCWTWNADCWRLCWLLCVPLLYWVRLCTTYIKDVRERASIEPDLHLYIQVKVTVLLDCGVQGPLQTPTPLVECRFITTVSGGTFVISSGTLVQMKPLWSAISWDILVPVAGARHAMIRKY